MARPCLEGMMYQLRWGKLGNNVCVYLSDICVTLDIKLYYCIDIVTGYPVRLHSFHWKVQR